MTDGIEKGVWVVGEARVKLADDLRAKYDAGEPIRSLVAATGRSYGSVQRMLSETGPMRGRGSNTTRS